MHLVKHRKREHWSISSLSFTKSNLDPWAGRSGLVDRGHFQSFKQKLLTKSNLDSWAGRSGLVDRALSSGDITCGF